jgi:hypothetical protein
MEPLEAGTRPALTFYLYFLRRLKMPKNSPAFTVEQMRDALEAADGRYYLAARALGCHSSTVQRYASQHAILREIVLQKRGERVDSAEGILWQKVQEGAPWAVIFFLKTQGRDRGYTERYDFSHEFKELNDEELASWIKARTGADGSSTKGSGTPGDEDPDEPTVH